MTSHILEDFLIPLYLLSHLNPCSTQAFLQKVTPPPSYLHCVTNKRTLDTLYTADFEMPPADTNSSSTNGPNF